MSDTRELLSEEKIATRIQELAKKIKTEFGSEKVYVIGVLTGGFIVVADLVRALWKEGMKNIQIDFVKTTSYINDSDSFRCPPKIIMDLNPDITDKNVLIVEDIADTGLTLQLLQNHLLAKKPKKLKTFALLNKPSRREVKITLDYIGFEVDGWIEGYGLDSIRACPCIMVRK